MTKSILLVFLYALKNYASYMSYVNYMSSL